MVRQGDRGLAGVATAKPQTTINRTSILPRVALEYGQTRCACCTKDSASARDITGTEIFSVASTPKPFGMAPMPTLAAIDNSPGKLILSRVAINFIAPIKHAA